MRYKAIKTRIKLDKDQTRFLLLLMRSAKNLYNQALYNVRQHFFDTGEFLTYQNNYHLLKTSENYKILNSSQAQTVIKKVDEAMKAFFGSIKSTNTIKVRLPRYLDKLGYYALIDRMVYKPQNGYYSLPRSNFIKRVSKYYKLPKTKAQLINSLSLPKELKIEIITPKCIINKQIKEITIKPKFDGKYIEVIHTYLEEDALENKNLKTETMGIDLGFNNLATCGVTNSNHLLIDGYKLKSLNQWYHKRMSYLNSTRPNQNVLTKQMMSLIIKRNNQMTYGINKAARLIINHAITNDTGEIIIGYNKDFKDTNLSERYNQMAKSIPLARLRDRIVYLATEYGIESKVINESYTSKASYLDNDLLPELDYKKHTFSGRRTKRGLYVSKEGKIINADLNAALNILKKGNPNTVRLGYSGVNTPKRTYLFG